MRKFYLLALVALMHTSVLAQQIFTAKVISDTNLPIANASVSLLDNQVVVKTDSNGVFRLPVNTQSVELHIVALGYQHLTVNLRSLKPRVFRLHVAVHQLNEVAIVENGAQNYQKQGVNLNTEGVKQQFIQRHLGGSLMQTLSRLPGVKSIGIGAGQSKPLIRGLGFNRVLVVDKGIKHEGQQWGADHGLEVDQFATGDVNLVKGAASFLYGSDAIGGAIDVLPAPLPLPNTLGGNVDLVTKSNNHHLGGSVNLYGRNNNWFFDARYTHQNYGDYRVPANQVFVYDYAVNLKNGYLRNTAGHEHNLHLSTGYADEHFKSVFYVSNLYTKSGFFANAHGLEPRRVDEALHDANKRDILLPNQNVNHFKLVNRTEWHAGSHSFDVSVGYQRNYRQEYSQYVSHGFMPSSYPTGLNIPIDLERQFDKSTYLGSLKDLIAFGKHQLSVGINGEYQQNNIGGWGFLIPAFDQLSTGAFLYDKYQLNKDVTLFGALRYDYGHIALKSYKDWFLSTLENGQKAYLDRAQSLSRNFSSLVWSVGANYTSKNFEMKANLGKSFRMPIAKELGANGVNYHYFSYEKGNANLAPEKSYQADLLLAWKSRRFNAQFTPFFNYFPNYIYLNPTAHHDYAYGAGNQVFEYQESRVMRYGAELQLGYKWLNSLSTTIFGEYLFAEQLSGSKSGFGLPFAPPPSALLNITYEPKSLNVLGHLFFSVDYRLTAPQKRIVPPEKETPGYQLVNLQAGTRFQIGGQQIILNLQVQNLFNAKYFQHTSFYRLIELPEQGRNVVLGLKIPFKIIKK